MDGHAGEMPGPDTRSHRQAALAEAREGEAGALAEPLTAVLVDDHLALRKGIELLLQREGCRVIGRADDSRGAFDLIQRRRPDVAIVDIALPGESGVELTRRLLERDPELGILLYTGVGDQEALRDALESGARGFAMKAGPPEELLKAIRSVAAGGDYIDPMLRSVLAEQAPAARGPTLSPREREVLGMLAEGLTGEEIARRLYLSAETVRTHVRNAMEKLGARTRVQAIAMALRDRQIRL